MTSVPPDDGGWRLVPYIKQSGRCPVLDWLNDELYSENPVAYWDFHDVWKPRFERNGPHAVGPPHWEGLKRELYEIRWDGNCRIYCSIESQRRIVMYLGCVKRWDIFDRGHRKTCDERRKDFRSTDYDQQARTYKYYALYQKRGQNGLA
jgi:hypothetical protein